MPNVYSVYGFTGECLPTEGLQYGHHLECSGSPIWQPIGMWFDMNPMPIVSYEYQETNNLVSLQISPDVMKIWKKHG